MDVHGEHGDADDGLPPGFRHVGVDDFGAQLFVDARGRRFRRESLLPYGSDAAPAVSDDDMALFVAAAEAEAAAGPAAWEPAGLPDPAEAVAGVFRPVGLPAVPRLVLEDPDDRAWDREDLAVFLRVPPAQLAEVLDTLGWTDRRQFSSSAVLELLVAGGMPEGVLEVDGQHLAACPERRVLAERREAAAALGIPEAAVAELEARATLGVAPMLVVLAWGPIARVDVTATSRMVDLAGGWLRHMLGFNDAAQRLELCVRLAR